MQFKEKIDYEVPNDDSAAEGERMLLYWLIRELKPKTVIETGTHRGLTALYMAHALYDNRQGHLVTCDPNAEYKQVNYFKMFPELMPYLTYQPVKGKDLDVQGIDFAFIDGFHEKEAVLEEIEMLKTKMSKTCVVVFHDCWYNGNEGVNEALEESGLTSLWIPTTSAIRIYSKYPDKPFNPSQL